MCATINKPVKKYTDRPKKDKAKQIYNLIYNTPMWRRLRRSELMTHPICQRCNKELATEVHHIKPISTANSEEEILSIGFDSTNLICLCTTCHQQVHRDLRR